MSIKRFVGLTLTLLVIGFGGRAFAAMQVTCHARDEAQVAALFEAWASDVHAGDSKALAGRYKRWALLQPDPKGKSMRRTKSRQRYFDELLARHPAIEVMKRHIKLMCNSAIDTGSYVIHFGDGTTSFWRYAITYDWDGRRWLIARHLLTPLPPPN